MSLANLVARIAAGETPEEIMANPGKAESVPPVPPQQNTPGTRKPAPILAVPPVPPVPPQNTKVQSAELESWEQWQAEHPSPGTTPLTADETLSLRAWLAFIGEHDKPTIADVLRTCERFPDTKAHCLNEARTTKARQVIAARAALEAAEERAAILEHDAKVKRTKAEEVAHLAEAFYNHLFGPGEATNCCYAPKGRYCAEGKRLRDAYYEAAKTAGGLS